MHSVDQSQVYHPTPVILVYGQSVVTDQILSRSFAWALWSDRSAAQWRSMEDIEID